MRRLAVDIQRAVALQLQLSLAVYTCFLVAAGPVGERILRILLHAELDALLVVDGDGSPAGVGHRDAGQLYRTFIGAVEGQRSVFCTAFEDIRYLVAIDVGRVGLTDADVPAIDRCADIGGDIAGDADACRRAVVGNPDAVVRHFRGINIHPADIADSERLVHDGQRGPAGVVHLAGFLRGKLIRDAARYHVQRLSLYCDSEYQGCDEAIYLLHFTTILNDFCLLFRI